MWIYYLHMLVIFVLSISLSISKVSLTQFFLLSSAFTLVIAVLIDIASTKIKSLKFLQFLIK